MIEKFLNLYARLFARKIFLKFNRLFFQMGLRGMGILNYANEKISGEHHFINKVLPNFNIRTVFDVGAHVGAYTAELLTSFPDSKYYCFEPNPETFKVMEKNLNHKNVSLFNIALSNEEGTALLYDHSEKSTSQLASLFKGAISEFHGSQISSFQVNLMTADKFMKTHGIDRISLLKIDTEGNELKVLQGASDSIRNNLVDIIQFEFNVANVHSRVFFRDFVEALPNYDFYRLLPGELLPIDQKWTIMNEIFAFQNIIAIRKDLNSY